MQSRIGTKSINVCNIGRSGQDIISNGISTVSFEAVRTILVRVTECFQGTSGGCIILENFPYITVIPMSHQLIRLLCIKNGSGQVNFMEKLDRALNRSGLVSYFFKDRSFSTIAIVCTKTTLTRLQFGKFTYIARWMIGFLPFSHELARCIIALTKGSLRVISGMNVLTVGN